MPVDTSTPPERVNVDIDVELDDELDENRVRTAAVRVGLLVVVAVFAVFWTWALFFASKEAVNRIEDRAWAERAELICQDANAARLELADFRLIDVGDDDEVAARIRERAEIVEASTDIIAAMLDDVVAVVPSDRKGVEIVPLWEADYRTYIDDRYTYAEQLRASGENLPFYETADGIPLSERIETFAGDNEMPACAPPRDLTR